jgi:hypothetical protein
MQGRRVYLDEGGELRLGPGDYGQDKRGVWFARPPKMADGDQYTDAHPLMGSLEAHDVVEHEDGTITVSPSILIEYPWGDPPRQFRWHGHLERGIWKLAQ